MASDVDGKFADDYQVVTREDVADLGLLPKRFDMFASEVRSSFELLGNRILPQLTKIESMLVDLGSRVSTIEAHQLRSDSRIDAIEAQLRALRRRPRKAT